MCLLQQFDYWHVICFSCPKQRAGVFWAKKGTEMIYLASLCTSVIFIDKELNNISRHRN